MKRSMPGTGTGRRYSMKKVAELMAERLGPRKKEDQMTKIERVRVKVARPILWRSADSSLVVVEGPFPFGLVRTETRRSVQSAAGLSRYDLFANGQTTASGHYALVWAKDVIAVAEKEENDFGPVCP